MYLLDTCIVSEARRQSPPALQWMAAMEPSRLHLSVITLGEVAKGIAMLERRDRVRSGRLRPWLARLQADYADRILPVDTAIALIWGRLMALRPRPAADALIAATALVHNLIVVTRNVAGFADTGVELSDPWAV